MISTKLNSLNLNDVSSDMVSLNNFNIPNIPIRVAFTSTNSNASIYVHNIPSLITTPSTKIYTGSELLTPKIFTAVKPTFKSRTKYKLYTIIKNNKYEAVLQIFKEGRWMSVNIDNTHLIEMDFQLSADEIDLLDDIKYPAGPTYKVRLIGDMAADQIVKYTTADNQTDYITNGLDTTITIVSNTPYITINRLFEDGEYNVTYAISNPGEPVPTIVKNDFKKELVNGITTIAIVTTKMHNVGVSSPSVVVDNSSLIFNYNNPIDLNIPYHTNNTDKLIYSIGNTKREISNNMPITLKKSDFLNGIGQYKLYIQPISDEVGSGAVVATTINVINKVHSLGPDITNITYPENIKGADFRGFNENFKIAWQSVNTDYIKIYINKSDPEFFLKRVNPNGSSTFNIADILRKSKKYYSENSDKINFNLSLIPYNIAGDGVVLGKEETISISFDKGDLRLRRSQVIEDIKQSFKKEFKYDILKSETSKYLTHYLHLGNGNNKLISTWDIDLDTFSKFITDDVGNIRKEKEEKTLILKLYEPLPSDIQTSSQVWISKIQSVPLIEQVTLISEEVDSCVKLSPDFSLDVGDDIGYQILDNLVASGSLSSTELMNKYIGENKFSLDILNLNYTSGSVYLWDNFIKYSSAKERVDNFFYKVKLIELHESTLDSLANTALATGSVQIKNETIRTNTKINNIKKGFDAFEKLLYTVSGSLSYPGAGQNNLSGSTSTATESWYSVISDSADEFDLYNINSLVNNIPSHIRDNSENADFVLFFNMIGQHFDILWSYINGLSEHKKLTHSIDGGITNELVYHMLESLGWDADMDVKSQLLWEYAFGKNKDNTEASSLSGKERQHAIWRRLLNNLPYLYKHKGTKRALTAAMACYGVPSSMLTILEFGGPVDTTTTGTSKFTFDDRTAALKFDKTASVLIPYHSYSGTSDYPNCVELRINTENKEDHKLIQTDGWDLRIIAGTGSLASIQFNITGSSNSVSASTEFFPFFNDEYTQIVINKTTNVSGSDVFDIYAKEGFNERIRNEASASLSISTGNSTWHYGTELILGDNFSGSIDEFRLWTTPLDESRIVNHTLLPDAIGGNHVSASTEDLIFRLDFEYPKDRSSTGDIEIKNVAINRSYNALSGSATNFTSVTTYPYQYIPYERSVTAVVPSTGIGVSNKIRFESQTLENYLKFGSISNVSSFENANDSSKLGLFFSPTKEINMDILRSLGQFNIDNYIGNPDDEYSDSYTALDNLRNYYFQRFTLNMYEYIQLVRYIDRTLFTTLESLIPGRAKVSTGLLIEPHILERSKVKHTRPNGEYLLYESSTAVEDNMSTTGSINIREAIFDTNEISNLTGNTNIYESNTSTETAILTSEKYNYSGNIRAQSTNYVVGETTEYTSELSALAVNQPYGEYDNNALTQVGFNPNSIEHNGFGIWADNGNTIRTYFDNFGNKLQSRQKVYKIKESYTVKIPQNIDSNDSTAGVELVNKTFYRYKITFIDFDQTAPVVSGNIIEVTPVDGYLKTHYKYAGDLPSGLANSYYIGSRQTSSTTLDGGAAVETFLTNPNVLKVNDSGRGSGTPILQVE